MDPRHERDAIAGEKLRKTLVLPAVNQPAASFDAVGTARSDEFAPIRVGGKIDGYKVEAPLAEGGMGAIYRVRDRAGERSLALKAPLPDGRGGTYSHRMRRFLREVRLASRMDHPGVAKVVEVGQDDGLPYFTMELIDGTPLSDRLALGPLAVVDALKAIESAARACHHIHLKNVVHRDIKPQNILVTPNGDAVVVDFGLARDAAGIDPRITQSGVWLGTPAYISPEQASGAASIVDARADVYSLGAVLYECLTGTPPYGAGAPKSIFRAMKRGVVDPVSERRTEVSPAVNDLVMKAIAREPKDRFATALDLADAIAIAIDQLTSAERRPIERSPLSSVGSLDLELGDPALSPIPTPIPTRVRLEEALAAGAADPHAKPKSTPRAKVESHEKLELAPESEDRWLQRGTSNAVEDARFLLDGDSLETNGKNKRSGDGSHGRRRARRSGSSSSRKGRIFDADGTTDAARLLAFGGPALIAAFGLLLLLL